MSHLNPHSPAKTTEQRFAHSPVIHVIGTGGPLFFAYMAYRSFVGPFVNGGMLLQIALVALCIALALAVLLLYLRSGIQRYTITDSGLVISRPWSKSVIPWQAIRRIDWNRPLHYVVLRGESSVIAFTSTDEFPNLLDLLVLVHERSACTLSPNLQRLIPAPTYPSPDPQSAPER